MKCDACGKEHVITGVIEVDGYPLRTDLVETVVELSCRHGFLGIPAAPIESNGPEFEDIPKP